MSAYISTAPKVFVWAILAVCLFVMISDLYQDTASLHWDFHTYYHASLAHASDLNPYEAKNISLVSGKNWTPPYLYPPLTLHLFSPFRVVDFPAAAKTWLFLKILLMVVLVLVWGRYFTRTVPLALFLFFLWFSFASTVYWDLKTGNVSLVEQFFLWLGFMFLVKDRPWGFCLLLLLASVFKLAMILFLPLLLVFNVRQKWLFLTATSLCFAGYLLANYLYSPEMFADYAALATSARDLGGKFNLGTLAFVKDGYRFAGQGDLKAMPLISYAGIVMLVLSFTIYFLKSSRASLVSNRPLTILFFCVLYAVLMPRMKCYSFIILIAPAYYIIRHCLTVKALPYLFLLLILPIRSPISESGFVMHFKNYYSLYLAYLLWGLFIRHIRQAADQEPTSDVSPTRKPT